jgi:hypothetical protein
LIDVKVVSIFALSLSFTLFHRYTLLLVSSGSMNHRSLSAGQFTD